MDLKEFNNTDLNLEILAEECAEVIQAKSKIARFGMKKESIDHLNVEVGDLLALIEILTSTGILNKEDLEDAKEKKIDSTPTLVIENVIFPNRNYSNLVTIINALLKEPVR